MYTLKDVVSNPGLYTNQEMRKAAAKVRTHPDITVIELLDIIDFLRGKWKNGTLQRLYYLCLRLEETHSA